MFLSFWSAKRSALLSDWQSCWEGITSVGELQGRRYSRQWKLSLYFILGLSLIKLCYNVTVFKDKSEPPISTLKDVMSYRFTFHHITLNCIVALNLLKLWIVKIDSWFFLFFLHKNNIILPNEIVTSLFNAHSCVSPFLSLNCDWMRSWLSSCSVHGFGKDLKGRNKNDIISFSCQITVENGKAFSYCHNLQDYQYHRFQLNWVVSEWAA